MFVLLCHVNPIWVDVVSNEFRFSNKGGVLYRPHPTTTTKKKDQKERKKEIERRNECSISWHLANRISFFFLFLHFVQIVHANVITLCACQRACAGPSRSHLAEMTQPRGEMCF